MNRQRIRLRFQERRNWLRRIFSGLGPATVAVSALLILVIGSRIPLPGLSGDVLRDVLRGQGGFLVWLYDRLAGGGFSRGAVLALGLVPYLSAQVAMWCARRVAPELESAWSTAAGRAKLRRYTAFLGVGLAAVQSIGFASFLQNLPGAVTHPGFAFVLQTTAVLTAGTAALIWLHTKFTKARDEADFDSSGTPAAADDTVVREERVELLSPPTPLEGFHAPRREPVKVGGAPGFETTR